MNKQKLEINQIISKLKELNISKIDLSRNEITINKQKFSLGQQGGFMSESSSDLFSETSVLNQNGGNNNLFSETSEFTGNLGNNIYSETSVTMNQNSGSKNYSETSDFNPNYKNKIYSETSVTMNQNGGKKSLYSDTSSFVGSFKNNLSETSMFKQNTDMYSETSDFKGGNTDVDTLHSITELENSQLDLDIFKKHSNQQKGGSLNYNKLKLNAVGINSSSTSSICE